jgi:hypothetical protein
LESNPKGSVSVFSTTISLGQHKGGLAGLERVVARSNFNGEEAISELLEN